MSTTSKKTSKKTSPVYAALRALGAAKAMAEFSGGHDDGYYDDDATLYDAKGKELATVVSLMGNEPHGADRAGIIARHFEDVLNGTFGGFGGVPTVAGKVIVDATNDTTEMVGAQEYPTAFKYVWDGIVAVETFEDVELPKTVAATVLAEYYG